MSSQQPIQAEESSASEDIAKKEAEVYDEVDPQSWEAWQNVKANFSDDRKKRLTWKLDLCIMTWLSYYYLLAWIDRGNAGNAKLFGLLEDLNMSGDDFNHALMVFFFTYAIIMLPTQYIVKRTSPHWVFPTMLATFGAVTLATGFTHNYGGFISCRLVLGLTEGGYFPGQVFVISCWYDKQQLQTRISVFYAISAFAAGFAGFIAYGVGNLDGDQGHRAWRYLYWIEGGITLGSGLIGYLLTTTWPSTSRILKEEERRFIMLRQRFISGKSPSTEENFRKKDFIAAWTDIKVYCSALNFFTAASTQYGVVYVLPTLVKSLGYTSQRAQALTAPPYVFAAFVTFFSSVWADRKQERMMVIIIGSFFTMVGLAIIWITLHYPNTGVTYFGCFVALGASYATSPALSAWIAVNTAGQAKRGVSIATVAALGTLGGVVGSNIFLESEIPTYDTGFGVSIAILFLCAFVPSCYCRYYAISRNREREKISEEEIRAKYTEKELQEMGDRSPLFRYTN